MRAHRALARGRPATYRRLWRGTRRAREGLAGLRRCPSPPHHAPPKGQPPASNQDQAPPPGSPPSSSPATPPGPSQPEPDKEPAIVALGDSYISGEGAGDYEPGTDGPSNFCHRSLKAAIKLTTVPGVDVAHRFNLACSGASAVNVLPTGSILSTGTHGTIHGGVSRYGEPPQGDRLATIAKQYDVKLVVLGIGGNSAGGNDLSFGSLLAKCMTRFAESFNPFIEHKSCRQDFEGEIIPRISVAAMNVAVTIDNLQRIMGEAGYKDSDYKFVLQSYPSPVTERIPLFPYPSQQLQWQVLFGCPLRRDDMHWARTAVVPQIGAYWREAAAGTGVSFLEMAYAAENREVCSGGVTGAEEWIRGVSIDLDRFNRGEFDLPTIQQSFHPNAAGHRQFARCLTAMYSSQARKGNCQTAPSGNLEFVPLP